MLARSTYRFEILTEPGQWVELRPLSWKRLQKCKDAKLRSLAESMQGIDLSALRDMSGPAADRQAATVDDPLLQHDLGEVLRQGIVDWSYGVPVTAEDIDDLDAATAAAIARQLLAPSARTEEEKTDRFLPSIVR